MCQTASQQFCLVPCRLRAVQPHHRPMVVSCRTSHQARSCHRGATSTSRRGTASRCKLFWRVELRRRLRWGTEASCLTQARPHRPVCQPELLHRRRWPGISSPLKAAANRCKFLRPDELQPLRREIRGLPRRKFVVACADQAGSNLLRAREAGPFAHGMLAASLCSCHQVGRLPHNGSCVRKSSLGAVPCQGWEAAIELLCKAPRIV